MQLLRLACLNKVYVYVCMYVVCIYRYINIIVNIAYAGSWYELAKYICSSLTSESHSSYL